MDLISRLSELRCQYNCFDESDRDAYHTLSEAIKALSDVPDTNVADCSDCIKHGGDWDCDHVHCHKGKSAQPETCAYWDRESNICALHRPSAQPEQRWIPCNWQTKEENLPQECKSVLICIEDSCGYRIGVSYRADYNRWEGYGRVNVIAWMPLPEPYIQ